MLALALGAWGCDDNNEMDSGTPGTDAGPGDAGGGSDAGPEDGGGGMMDGGGTDGGGTDAGPAMNFEIRLVNNIPGLTGTTGAMGVPGGFHVCIYIANNMTGAVVGAPRFATQSVGPIPFRGVSPYLAFPSVAPFNYIVALYDPPNMGDPAACPADPNATGAATAALIATVEPTATPVDSRVTAIASGLIPDSLGATGGALPSICFNGTGGFDAACTTATQLVTVIDDQTSPATGMTRFRVSNMVPNSTPPSGFNVCYDPGLVPNTDGSCMDLTASGGDESALATVTPYGTVTDYADHDAVVPTGTPMAGVGGGLYIALEMGSGCPDFAASGSNRCYPILGAWPTPMAADEIVPMLAADTINTIFISGAIAQSAPNNPSFFIWQDDYVAP